MFAHFFAFCNITSELFYTFEQNIMLVPYNNTSNVDALQVSISEICCKYKIRYQLKQLQLKEEQIVMQVGFYAERRDIDQRKRKVSTKM